MDRFVSREQWGATERGATVTTHPIGETLGVTLHWEGPTMGAFEHSECAGKVRGIQTFHKVSRGWADIAYNFVACPHGFVFEGRGVGVKSAANGDTQTNEDWYAVCYLGGVNDGLTDEGKAGFTFAIQLLRRAGAGQRVNGHRDHKATSCPGDTIYAWLQTADFSEQPVITSEDREAWQRKRDRVRDIIERLKTSPIPRAPKFRDLLKQALNQTRSE